MTLFSKTTRLWNRQHLLWLFLSIALFTRLAFVYLHPPEAYISSDMADYHNLALKLAETGKEDISATRHTVFTGCILRPELTHLEHWPLSGAIKYCHVLPVLSHSKNALWLSVGIDNTGHLVS